MTWAVLVAFGLTCLALVGIIWHPTGRIVAAVLAAVLFLLAGIVAVYSGGLVPGA